MNNKILFFIDGLGSGGAQKQLVTLAIELKKRGYKVEVAFYHDEDFFKKELINNDVNYFFIKKGTGVISNITFPLKLANFIFKRKYQCVVSFLEGPCFYAEIAKILSLFNFKLIVSERFMTVGKLSFKAKLLSFFHRVADAITANSHHQRKRMELDNPWMKKCISTIYNGYHYNNSPKNISSLNNGTNLLVVSSLASKKNPLNLIKAVKLLVDDGYEVKLRWAGSTITTGEGNYVLDKCNDLIEKLELRNNIEFIGEIKSIENEYVKANWLVHPSFYEGLPNAICEALAFFTPVIASNVCDHPILVEQSGAGFVFNPSESHDIAQKIKQAINLSNSDYVKCSESAFNFYSVKLTSKRFCDEYQLLIERL